MFAFLFAQPVGFKGHRFDDWKFVHAFQGAKKPMEVKGYLIALGISFLGAGDPFFGSLQGKGKPHIYIYIYIYIWGVRLASQASQWLEGRGSINLNSPLKREPFGRFRSYQSPVRNW